MLSVPRIHISTSCRTGVLSRWTELPGLGLPGRHRRRLLSPQLVCALRFPGAVRSRCGGISTARSGQRPSQPQVCGLRSRPAGTEQRGAAGPSPRPAKGQPVCQPRAGPGCGSGGRPGRGPAGVLSARGSSGSHVLTCSHRRGFLPTQRVPASLALEAPPTPHPGSCWSLPGCRPPEAGPQPQPQLPCTFPAWFTWRRGSVSSRCGPPATPARGSGLWGVRPACEGTVCPSHVGGWSCVCAACCG